MHFYLIRRYTILLIFNLQKKRKCTALWICGRQQLWYPSGSADQVYCSKENAWLCSFSAELSQSPHTCNGGRIKFSAERWAASINSSRISPLADNWKDYIQFTKSLNLTIGTLSRLNMCRCWQTQLGAAFDWSQEAWGKNCKAGTGVVTSVLHPEQSHCSVLLQVPRLYSRLPVNILTGQCFQRFGLVILKLS